MTKHATFPWPTVGGYDLKEVLSAFQKSIRRGLDDDALFWGTELFLSDYANHAWKRLLVIASEDIGIADSVTSTIVALRDSFKSDPKSDESRLYFIHAILALTHAKKSRLVDYATIIFFEGPREKREIPDYALDVHTEAGRTKGRGYKHFFEEGTVLFPPELDHPYKERAKEIRCGKKR